MDKDLKFTTAGDYMTDEPEDYDVVQAALEEKRASLWAMTKRNLNSEMGLNIMDDIRLAQIDQLEEALEVWKAHKNEQSHKKSGEW